MSNEATSDSMSGVEEMREVELAMHCESHEERCLRLNELHCAQIAYMLKAPTRLLAAERSNIWREFIDEHGDEYTELTAEMVSAEFNEHILPRLDAFNLGEEELHLLSLLKMHPEYEELPGKGYKLLPKNDRVAHRLAPQLGVDCRLVPEQDANLNVFERYATMEEDSMPAPKKFKMSTGEGDPHSHTLIFPQSNMPRKYQVGKSIELSQENGALMSAMLSNDWELSDCVLHEPTELHTRLRNAKREFVQKALMPVNCIPPKEMIAKMQDLKKLKETVAELMSKRFMHE